MHPLDPAIHFAAGAITAAVIICFVLLALDALWPEGRRKRK